MSELIQHLRLACLQHPDLFDLARLTPKQREVFNIISKSSVPVCPRDLSLKLCINKEWAKRLTDRLHTKGYLVLVDVNLQTYESAM